MAIKNADLPGVEGAGVSALKIPAIEKAFDEYVPIVEKRMTITPKEVEAKGKVLAAMHANEDKLPRDDKGNLFYVYDDKRYTLKPGKEKITRSKIVVDEEEE